MARRVRNRRLEELEPGLGRRDPVDLGQLRAEALGKELAKTGVIANCVAPSAVDTEMLGDVTQEYLDNVVLARMPIGRPGRPEEAAALIAWLASEDCSFCTGAVFDLSGGRAVY